MSAADLSSLPAGDAYTVRLGDLISRVNGFVYAGDRTDQGTPRRSCLGKGSARRGRNASGRRFGVR
jgi:hypothetical protein